MKYREQYERMIRYYNKIKQPKDGDHLAQLDNIYSFFQSAWHLKDWIKNDSAICFFNIEKIVEKKISLMKCADLANGSKHLELTRPRTNSKFDGNDVLVKVGMAVLNESNGIYYGKSIESEYTFWIKYGSQRQCVNDLADQIVNDWNEIIELLESWVKLYQKHSNSRK